MNIGKSEILSEPGEGGFGMVLRAHDTLLDFDVALKVLKPVWTDDRPAVESFYREARAAVRLDYRSIVDVR